MTPEQERALAAMAQAPSMRAARVWELDPFSPPEPEPPPPTAPSMRAATWMETLRDRLAQAFEALAQQPGVQAAGKALGQVAPVLEEATYGNLRPGTGWEIGMMPDLPGQVPGMPGFYSRLDRAVATLPNKPVHPNAVLNAVKGKTSQEEMQWRRLAEFLSGKTQVTRAEVEDWLAQHPISLETVQKGVGHPEPRMIVRPHPEGSNRGWVIYDARNNTTITEGTSPRERVFPTRMAAEQFIEERGWQGTYETGATPKFAQYQVPGGEAYRETLTTLRPASDGWEVFDPRTGQVVARVKTEAEAREMAVNELDYDVAGSAPEQNYLSPHWNEPNVLGHTRENERTLPTGERGLFVEEMQSDWHQKGKAKGYRISAAEEEALKGKIHRLRLAKDDLPLGDPGRRELDQQIADALDQYNATINDAVPDAPFKDTWDDLLFKQRLLEAAQRDDLDWVGWTTGETQADRYSLKKHINELEWEPQSQRLHAYDHEGKLVINQQVSEADLPEYIGSDAARRLLASEDGTLSGEQLAVGGEGMHEFYDKRRVARAEKTVKPFGGAVERAPVSTSDYPIATSQGERNALAARVRNKVDTPTQSTPAWLVRLPPEMKAKIREQGLPLLSVLALLSAQGLKPQPSHEVAR